MRSQLSLLTAFLVLVAIPAAAQESSQRLALDRFQDSVARVWDVEALRQLERHGIELARVEREDPMHHLRLGILALRLAHLEPESPHLDDALGEFEWAADLRPDWPWPWYGIGLAEARGANRAGGFAGGLWTMLGLDRDRLAGVAFARAIAADPSFLNALLDFADVALEQRIDAPLSEALLVLRAAGTTSVGWDHRLLMARGRVERLSGDPDSAVVAFRRTAALSRLPAAGWLEVARTLPLLTADGSETQEDRDDVLRYYLAAAESRAPTVTAMLRRDLEPLATSRELRQFDRVSGKQRSEWLATWWAARDAVDLREPGSRLSEHFRRWDVARREFRLPPFRRRYRFGMETFRSGDSELDDRGIVYLRHGEPSLRIEWPKGRTAVRFNADALRRSYGSETWRYDRPDGALVLHFAAQFDQQDYRLVETPMDLDVATDVLARRAHEVPGLERLIRAGGNSAAWISEEVRSHTVRSMAIATQTDSWQRSYSDILSGRVRWYVAGVRDGEPLVHIVYSIDAEQLRQSASAAADSQVPVHLRASFFDRSGNAVATLDTVQLVGIPSARAELVAARAEVPVPSGRLWTRLGIELSPSVGVIYPVDSIVTPNPHAARLQLSAVLVGKANQSLSWAISRADTAWLDAASVYAPTDTLTLYAESYGIPSGSRAQVELSVTRHRGGLAGLIFGDHKAISIGQATVGDGSALLFHRELALNDLEPGDYTLDLVVSSAGESVKRSRGLRIRR